jgi:hypothetical protein
MSQHDFDIDNATAAAARVDINLALKALGSLSSGASAPVTTYANMLWYDTATNWLYVRNEANSAWVRFAFFDQTTNRISLVDDTSIVNTSGAQVGLLGDQSTGTWQAGTGTTPSLVSPANVKAAVQSLSPPITSASVGSATAGIAATAVGSYILAWDTTWTSGTRGTGSTIAGTSLRPTGFSRVDEDYNTTVNKVRVGYGGALGGTWRLMGYLGMLDGYGKYVYTGSMYLRIS